EVRAVLVKGDTIYVGGSFTSVGPATGGFAGFDAASAAYDSRWPSANGSLAAMAPDGRGGWYIAGNFSAIGAQPRRGLAHISADRSVDPGWAPATDKPVAA